MNENTKYVVGSALLAVGVVGSICEYRHVAKKEREKRAQIEKDYRLDVAAIKRAGEVAQRRIADGPFRPLREVMQDLDNEIAFQKIAIRNEK